VIFVIENNQYAMGTSVKRSTMSRTYWERGAAYGIAGEEVDGMDVLAVKAAGDRAVAHCRSGAGPYILEVKTYRFRGHSMSDPAKYRTREEVQKMKDERDPIEQVRSMLLTGNHATEDDLKAIDREIKDIVNESAEFSKESPEPALSELWTDIVA
jgi:pyruvate dehydrogenase E1 component alpha subunit